MRKYILTTILIFAFASSVHSSNNNNAPDEAKSNQRRTFVMYSVQSGWTHNLNYTQHKVTQGYLDRNFISFSMVADDSVNFANLSKIAPGIKRDEQINFRIYLGAKLYKDMKDADEFPMPGTKENQVFNPSKITIRWIDDYKFKTLKARIDAVLAKADASNLNVGSCDIPASLAPTATLQQRHDKLSEMRKYYHQLKKATKEEDKRKAAFDKDVNAQKTERDIHKKQRQEALNYSDLYLSSDDDDTFNSSDDADDRETRLDVLRTINEKNEDRLARYKQEQAQLEADNRTQETTIEALKKIHDRMDELTLGHQLTPTFQAYDKDVKATVRAKANQDLQAQLKACKDSLAQAEKQRKLEEAKAKAEAKGLENDKRVLSEAVNKLRGIMDETAKLRGNMADVIDDPEELEGSVAERSKIIEVWQQKVIDAQNALREVQAHAKLVEGRNQERLALVKQLEAIRKSAGVEEPVVSDGFAYKHTKEQMDASLQQLRESIKTVPQRKDKEEVK